MPQISSITDSSMKLEWTAPESDGGAPITSYTIEYIKRGDTQWATLPTNNNQLRHTVNRLQTDANYSFRVSATNKVSFILSY